MEGPSLFCIRMMDWKTSTACLQEPKNFYSLIITSTNTWYVSINQTSLYQLCMKACVVPLLSIRRLADLFSGRRRCSHLVVATVVQMWERAISELLFYLFQNESWYTTFHIEMSLFCTLIVSPESNAFPRQRLCTRIRFETGVKRNSEMAPCGFFKEQGEHRHFGKLTLICFRRTLHLKTIQPIEKSKQNIMITTTDYFQHR